MNKIKSLTAIFIIFIITSVSAAELDSKEKQEQMNLPPKILLDPDNLYFSGYWGVYSSYSKIADTNGFLMGPRAGLTINNNFAIGLGAMFLLYPKDVDKLCGDSYSGVYKTASFNYGGLLLEYYLNPKDLIVFSAGSLIGGGSFKLSGKDAATKKSISDDSKFFTVEPEINVFINITRSCRFSIGTSYRYVSGINLKDFKSKDFNGFTASAMVQLGWF